MGELQEAGGADVLTGVMTMAAADGDAVSWAPVTSVLSGDVVDGRGREDSWRGTGGRGGCGLEMRLEAAEEEEVR